MHEYSGIEAGFGGTKGGSHFFLEEAEDRAQILNHTTQDSG